MKHYAYFCYMILMVLTAACAGLLVSFLGQLPIGNLNFTALELKIKWNTKAAIQFLAAVVVVEGAYIFLTLKAVNWLQSNSWFLQIFNWITVLVFIALAIYSFKKAYTKPSTLPSNTESSSAGFVALGMGMSLLNAAQVPFWLFWNGYFRSNNILNDSLLLNLVYLFCAMLGTVLGSLSFIYLGQKLVNALHNSQFWLYFILGLVFFSTALYHIYRLMV